MPFPRLELEINALLKNWTRKAPDHKTIYNLTDAQLAQISDDSIVYSHTLLSRQLFASEKAKLSAYKTHIFFGDPKAADAPFPSVSIPPLPPTLNPPKPGIIPRNTELYNFFKNHPNRTDESLADLGILTAARPPVSPDELKVNGEARNLSDDKVELSFKKQGQAGVRWQMKRGEENWGNEKDAQVSPLIDETPSVDGNPEKRFYRAVYLKKNKPFGQYSAIFTVVTTP